MLPVISIPPEDGSGARPAWTTLSGLATGVSHTGDSGTVSSGTGETDPGQESEQSAVVGEPDPLAAELPGGGASRSVRPPASRPAST